VVTNENGNVYADEEGIVEELYSLNRFYQGSAEIVAFSSSCRASLVATTLVKSASKDFQRTALMLENHSDILHELMQYADIDAEGQETYFASSPSGPDRKRRRG
jgi:hypothetical protein